jgi:hypothetical protein
MRPTILLQLLFAASLTILVMRLNIKFSTLPVKEQEEDHVMIQISVILDKVELKIMI